MLAKEHRDADRNRCGLVRKARLGRAAAVKIKGAESSGRRHAVSLTCRPSPSATLLLDHSSAAATDGASLTGLHCLHASLCFIAALEGEWADLRHDFIASRLGRRDRAVVRRRV